MTIEERAKEKSKIYCRQYRHNASWLGEDFVYSNEEIELACKEIATEQKQIDIEKFKQWLGENPSITYLEENRDILSKLLKMLEE